MGCVFAALIALAALGASTLVSLLWRSPQQVFVIAAGAVALVAALALVFRIVIRRIGGAFAEQDRLRRQLMADVAHELRTPLAILRGRIEGLLDGVYPRDESHLAELLEETLHLSRLVEDLGTLSHAEAGALELRKETVDLGDLVRDVAAALPRTIAVAVPADLPTVEVDPVRIRQVLLNLLANALRHTPADREIVVEVQAGAATDSDPRARQRLRHRAGGSAAHLRALSERERLGRLRPRPRHRPQAGAGARR